MPRAALQHRSYTVPAGRGRRFRGRQPSADPGRAGLLTQQNIPLSPMAGRGEVTMPVRRSGQPRRGPFDGRRGSLVWGHRDIAFIDGPEDSFPPRNAFAGLSEVLARGADPRADLIRRGDDRTIRRRRRRWGCSPTRGASTAIMVGNLVLATGCCGACTIGACRCPAMYRSWPMTMCWRYPRAGLSPDLSGTASAPLPMPGARSRAFWALPSTGGRPAAKLIAPRIARVAGPSQAGLRRQTGNGRKTGPRPPGIQPSASSGTAISPGLFGTHDQDVAKARSTISRRRCQKAFGKADVRARASTSSLG